jgi:hypothetical protein
MLIKVDDKKQRKEMMVPIQADPNHRELYKIGREIAQMKRCGESKERINREFNNEALKYTNKNKIK